MAKTKVPDSKNVNAEDINSSTIKENSTHSNDVDSAVAEGGAYDVIRKRLDEQGRQL